MTTLIKRQKPNVKCTIRIKYVVLKKRIHPVVTISIKIIKANPPLSIFVFCSENP